MTDFTIYDTTSGKILAIGNAPVPSDQIYGPDQDVVTGVIGDPATQYVSGGSVVSRPTVSASIDVSDIQADGFDAATVTGMPTGWAYAISNGDSGTTDGTDVVLTAIEAGTYTITFTNWPYQDVEFTVDASSTVL